VGRIAGGILLEILTSMDKQNGATNTAHETVRDKTRLMRETDWQAMKCEQSKWGNLNKRANSNCKN
jgi:hypothetical protein